MASKLLSVDSQITSFAFNANCSMLAVALANSEVEVYQFQQPNKWNKVAVLSKHDGRVTGIDWAPDSNRIVTCGSDRNAYVWQYDNATRTWNAQLVLLRIGRAATTVKWSPDEKKFAVGSSQRLVTICYFEPEQKCWVSKHIKKPIKSTITCISWHPCSYLIAAGSSDSTARVFSTYLKDIEERPKPTPWGTRMPFGAMMQEHVLLGWCAAVSFSPDGGQLAITGHDSTFSIATGGNPDLSTFYGKNLPFCSVEWLSHNQCVAVGHDRCSYVFTITGAGITCDGRHTGKGSGARGGGFGGAMSRFRNMDVNAQQENVTIDTAHSSSITDLRISDGVKGRVNSFATCSGDGNIYLWPWGKLAGGLTPC